MIRKFFSASLLFVVIGLLTVLVYCTAAPADDKKPKTSDAKKPDTSKEVPKVDSSQITVKEDTTEHAIRGVTAAQPPPATKPVTFPDLPKIGVRGGLSGDDENIKNEPDPKFVPARISPAAFAAISKAPLPPNQMYLRDVPNAKALVTQAANLASQNEINVALLGQHKYMLNSCLGVKVSVGEFKLKLANPTVTIADEGVIIEFKIDRIVCNAFTLRFRPDVLDLVEPCHFSSRYGLGGEARDVSVRFTYNPIVDVEKCMIGSPGAVSTKFAAGHVELNPLPPGVSQFDDLFKDMVIDALNYAMNLETGIGGQTGVSTGPFIGVMMDKLINHAMEANCPFKNANVGGGVVDATKSAAGSAARVGGAAPRRGATTQQLPAGVGGAGAAGGSTGATDAGVGGGVTRGGVAQAMFTLTPTPDARGRLGRLVVDFPEDAKATKINLYRAGESKEIKSWYGDSTMTLMPGSYDVSISGHRVANVTIQTGNDTTMRVGVLKTTADKATKYILRDADDKTALVEGYGAASIGLPIGQYHLVIADVSNPITIEGGKTLEY